MVKAAGNIAPSGVAGRSALPAAALAVGGALVAVLFHPTVGLPIAGTALASLAMRGHVWLGAFVLSLGTVLATALADSSVYVVAVPLTGVPVTARAPIVFGALMVASLATVGPGAVSLLRRRSALGSVVVIAMTLAGIQLAALALLANGAGSSLGEYVGGATRSLGEQAGLDEEIALLLVQMWPGVLVTASAVAAFLAVAGVGRVSARLGVPLNRLPSLAVIDLDPRTVIVPIIAVALLAAGRLVEEIGLFTLAGVNILVVARWVFFLQGLAVFAGLYEKGKVSRPFRAFGFVFLGVTEAFAPVVSLTGLADIWLNIRRLPRENSAPGETHGSAGVD